MKREVRPEDCRGETCDLVVRKAWLRLAEQGLGLCDADMGRERWPAGAATRSLSKHISIERAVVILVMQE